MLLINYDAQLAAWALMKAREADGGNGRVSQSRYELNAGGISLTDIDLIGAGQYFSVLGLDGREYVFTRSDLDLTDKVVRTLSASAVEILPLMYLVGGKKADKAKYLGLSRFSLIRRHESSVLEFSKRWHEAVHDVKLAQGTGVMGQFGNVSAAANEKVA